MALSLPFNLSIQFVMPFFAISKLRTAQNLHDWIFFWIPVFKNGRPAGFLLALLIMIISKALCSAACCALPPTPSPNPSLYPHTHQGVSYWGGGVGYMAPRVAPGALSPCFGKKYPPLGAALCSRGALFAWAAPQNGFVFPFLQSSGQVRSALFARFARTRASLAALFAKWVLPARYAPPLPRFASGRRFNSPALAWRRPLFSGNKNPSKTAIGYSQKIAAARSPRGCAKRTSPSAHPR